MKRIFWVCLLGYVGTLFAKDLGNLGHTYSVQEKSLLALIDEHIHEYQAGEGLSEYEAKIQKRVAARVVRPTPVRFAQTSKTHCFYYDPSIRLNQDLRTPDGRLIAPMGTEINPLERLPTYNPVWIFINFDDANQRRFALPHIKKYPDAHWILTGGNVLDAENSLQVPIYFDQLGRLTAKLKIQHVPAIVVREGLRLKITEIALRGKGH